MYLEDYELMGRTKCRKCSRIFGLKFQERPTDYQEGWLEKHSICTVCEHTNRLIAVWKDVEIK